MKSPIQLLKDLTFRKKILMCSLLVSIIPVTILGAFCYQQTKDLLVAQEEANLQTSLQQAAASLDNQIQIYNNLSDYLACLLYTSNAVQSIQQFTPRLVDLCLCDG